MRSRAREFHFTDLGRHLAEGEAGSAAFQTSLSRFGRKREDGGGSWAISRGHGAQKLPVSVRDICKPTGPSEAAPEVLRDRSARNVSLSVQADRMLEAKSSEERSRTFAG